MRHRGRDRGWFLYSERRNVRPSLFISRGNRGIRPSRRSLFQKSPPLPRLPKTEREREQRSAPTSPPAPPTPSTSSTASAMAPKADKGKGVKSAEAQRLAALRKERAIFPPACREGAEGVLLPLLVDGDASASVHEGTSSRRLENGSKRISFLRLVLLLRALPALL